MDEKLNWQVLAGKFALDGDMKGMRACARELFDAFPDSAEGPAIMAEAALYAGNRDEAELLAGDALELEPQSLRARLVMAGLAGLRFEVETEIKALQAIVKELKTDGAELESRRKTMSVRLHLGRAVPEAEKNQRQNDEARRKVNDYLMFKAQGWLADALYLAADPAGAAKALLTASRLAASVEDKVSLYSKYLFMLNYRTLGPDTAKEAALTYGKMLPEVGIYSHSDVKRTPEKRLRIGYISPDFRQHAVAYFLAPLLRDYDRQNFAVHCYSAGLVDKVTQRFQHYPVNWRDIRGRSARTVARLIAEDHIDILVDLSGHSQNNLLDVLAYRPAPIQVTAIGYMNTTGLPTMDYFLSDVFCSTKPEPPGFTEKVIRLPHSHLCYDPGAVREMPAPAIEAPVRKNGFITFGSFNNVAKLTDELLCIWRSIMDRVRQSRLVIKGKICSIPEGRTILRERLRRLHFELARVDLRPYSPDYLEQYRDIDIALDTAPYTGGLTTCEALFMGVPVVTLKGHSHNSRFGTGILRNAELKELIANNQMEYVKKIMQLATNPELLQRYHQGLRQHLLKSPLMDSKNYMRELESAYREIWQNFCAEGARPK
ncbi:MAG: hypothetical protein IJ849_10080 [Selenomonadaceae bacterium]|nr:hypothetical protein [Selenomonadaceae bacterium]